MQPWIAEYFRVDVESGGLKMSKIVLLATAMALLFPFSPALAQKQRISCEAYCTKRCASAQQKGYCMGRCVPGCNMTRATKK
jgi:hypothetical protein